MKITISSIDLAKFFFCCCIIILHTKVLTLCSEDVWYYITKNILRTAVPFFFVASGYFLGEKISRSQDLNDTINSYCKRLLLPLSVFAIINYIELDLQMLTGGGKSVLHVMLSNIRSLLFYPPGALWFVLACIVGSQLLKPFLKRGKLKLAIIIGIVLYLCALLANNYYFLILGTSFQKIVNVYMSLFISPRNGLFVGFIFLSVGIYCSRINVSPRISYVLAVFFGLCLLFETIVLKGNVYADEGSLYISHLFSIPTLLLALKNININIKYELSLLLRNLSTGMYYLHKPILFVVCLFSDNLLIIFLMTFIISLLICLSAYKSKVLGLDKLLR